MTAPHLSKMHAPCRDRFAWVGLMLMAAGPAFAAEEPATPPPAAPEEPYITAVYKAQEVNFNYRPARQAYSCQDLEHRVAVILVSMGARDDIKVSARNCDNFAVSGDTSIDIDPTMSGRNSNDPLGRDRNDPFGRDGNDPFGRGGNDPWGRSGGSFGRSDYDRAQSISFRINLMMPVELTPQIQKEVEKDKSRRELVSRVTRNPAAAMNDPIVFAARRQEVTLSQQTIKLAAEDCDLLQQMTQQLIRRLDVHVKHQSFGCGPRTSSRIPPKLTVEALMPTGKLLPMPDPEKQKKSGSASNPETQASDPQ